MHKKAIITVFLFVLTFILLSININKTFEGIHDWNGVRYGNIARNFLRYGIFSLSFGSLENAGKVSKNEFVYYTHYPPLLPIMIATSYNFFGISEWSTRLIPIIATAGSISLIFLIVAFFEGAYLAFIASLLVLFTPLVLYFGKTPVHEPVVVAFILLSYFLYLKKTKSKEKVWTILFFISLVLTQLIHWAGYFLIPAMTLTAILKKDFKQAKSLFPYWLLSGGLFGLHFLHTYVLTGSILGEDLEATFLDRTNFSARGQFNIQSLFEYVNRLRLWFFTLLSYVIVSLSIIWIISCCRKKLSEFEWVVVTFALLAGLFALVFSKILFVHNYLIFYCLPFFAFSSALGFKYICKIIYFKKISSFILVLILTFIILERHNFLQALSNSNSDRFAVQLGRELGKQTKPTDTILIEDKDFYIAAQYFMKFYSDRNLISTNSTGTKVDVKVLVDSQKETFEIIK